MAGLGAAGCRALFMNYLRLASIVVASVYLVAQTDSDSMPYDVPGKLAGPVTGACQSSVRRAYKLVLGSEPSYISTWTPNGYSARTSAGTVRISFQGGQCKDNDFFIAYHWSNHSSPLELNFSEGAIRRIMIAQVAGGAVITVVDSAGYKLTKADPSPPLGVTAWHPQYNSLGPSLATIAYPKDRAHTGTEDGSPVWYIDAIIDTPNGPKLERHGLIQ